VLAKCCFVVGITQHNLIYINKLAIFLNVFGVKLRATLYLSELVGMRHSSIIQILRLLMRSENNKMALWNKAEPISLDELKAKIEGLVRDEFVSKVNESALIDEELTFEELWKVFESLEELEEFPVV